MLFNKKCWLLLCSMLIFAQQIWALSNTINTDYLRTLNRSASMGSSDAMFFNPAGLIYLSDGTYFDFDLGLGVFKKEFDFQNATAGSSGHFPRSLSGAGMPAISLGYAKKEDDHALYFTLSPTMSSLFFLDNALSESHETGRVNYKHYDIAYEAALGYAMQVHEIIAVSFGGKLLMQFQGANDTYYTWGAQATALNEGYRYHGVLVGVALHAGVLVTPLSWLSAAFNLHSGSVLVGGSFVSHEGPGGGLWDSEREGRPQGGLMTQSDPARMDVGLFFNINEIARLQLTGQMQLRLFQDKNGFIYFNQLKPHVTWNVGTGVDFNLPGNVILGFGILYSHDLPYAPSNYYELLRAVELNQLQSIAVGLGFCVPVGSVFSISVSGMMPIYFDGGSLTSEKISLSVPRLNNFSVYNFVFSLGVKMKWSQPDQQSV